MKKFVWGCNPYRLRRLGQPDRPAPLTAVQLARIGIPARKIPRVQAELGRLAPGFPDRAVQIQLAKEIAKRLA